MSQEFDNKVLDLVKQKGFYPYEYMRGFEKFKEELPSKEKFYSLLTVKRISDNEYDHVLNVCDVFEMKTMKDYHDRYLKHDALLLADVFEKFRNSILKKYGLCSNHYLHAPGLSSDAMLNMEKVVLELIPDADMYLFFEEDMIGRLFYISNRYSKASNKYLISYDPKQKSKHIIYLEPNNLFGYAMSKFLPTRSNMNKS